MSEEKKEPKKAPKKAAKKESKGIKELLEFIAALENIAVVAAKVTQDKRISLSDWQYLKQFSFDSLEAGLEGFKEIPAEAKDLDNGEIIAVIGRLLEAVEKVKAAA